MVDDAERLRGGSEKYSTYSAKFYTAASAEQAFLSARKV
jgi:hypothetical protein